MYMTQLGNNKKKKNYIIITICDRHGYTFNKEKLCSKSVIKLLGSL